MPGHYASFAYSDPFEDAASLSLFGGRILDDSEEDTEQEEGGPPKLTTAQLARLRELVKNMPRFYGADESGMTAAGSTDPSGMEGADVEAAYTNYFEELKAYNATINQFLEDEGIPRFYKDDKGDTYYLNIGDPGQPSSFTDMYWTGEYDPQQKPGNYIQEGAVGLYGTRFDEIAEFNESQFAAGLKTVAAAVVGDYLAGLAGAEVGGSSIGVLTGQQQGEEEDVLSEEGINPYLAYLTGKTLSEEEEEEEDTTTVDATQGFLNTLNTAEEALQNADDEVTTATEALQESNESYDETISNYQKRLEDEKRRYGVFRARNMPYYKRLEKLKKQAEIDKQTEATKLQQTIAAAQTERDNARKEASYAEREYNESVKLKQAADQRQAEQDARDRIMGEKAAADYLKILRDSMASVKEAQAETVETAEVDIPVTTPEVVEEIEEDITLQIPEPIQETVTESEQEAEEEAEQAAEAVISEAAPQDTQTQAKVSEGAPSEEIQAVQYDTEGRDDLIIARQLEEIIEAEKEAGNDELAAALEDELEKYLEGDDGVVQESENIFESEEFEQAPEAGQDPVDVTSILLGTVPNLSTAGEISEEPTEELFTQGQVDDFIRTAEQSFENTLASQLAEQREEFEETQAEEAAEAAEAVEQATAQGREEGFGEGFGEGQGQGRGEGAGAGLGAGLGLGLGLGLLSPRGVTQSLFKDFKFTPTYQAPELQEAARQFETPNFLQGLFRDVA